MNPISIVGAFIITLSLLSYGIGSITLSRFKIVSTIVLIFLSFGVVFDVVGMIFMVLGARGTPFTLHGFLGYIAFIVMFVDVVWAWSVYFKKGLDARVKGRFLIYARFAYIFWVCAYITGSLIVLWR